MGAIPGLLEAGTFPVAVLPDEYSLSQPSEGGIVQQLPTVSRTYLLFASVHDPENFNLLHESDSPSSASWLKDEVSVTAGLADPEGGTDAWSFEKTTANANKKLHQALPAGDGEHRSARLCFRAGGGSLYVDDDYVDDDYVDDVSPDDSSVDVALWDGSSFLQVLSVRKLAGPGTLVAAGSGEVARLTGLLADAWTEVEVVWEETAPGSTLEAWLHPGTRDSTLSGADVWTFRPQFQVGSVSTSRRATTELNGPEGAPGVDVLVHLSNNGWASGGSGNVLGSRAIGAHQLFRWGLAQPYNASAQLFQGARISGQALPGFGDVEVVNPNGEHDELLRYTWSNRPLEIYFGDFPDNFASFKLLFAGTAEALSWTPRGFSIQLRDKQFKLNKPLQDRLFAGTGAALRLDGVGDGAVVQDHPAAMLAGDVTVEALVRFFAKPSVNVANTLACWEHETAGTLEEDNALWSFRLQADTSNRLSSRHQSGAGVVEGINSGDDSFPAAYYTDGLWHHVAMVRRVADLEVDFYLDGALLVTAAMTDLPTGGWRGRLHVGATGTAHDTNEFEGDLDEVRVWGVARTAEELDSNRGRELAGNEEGLAAYYKLNEGTGFTETFDSVSNRLDRRQREQGLKSAGASGDYVQVPDAAELSPTAGKWTWEAMVAFAQRGDDLATTVFVMRKDLSFRLHNNTSGQTKPAFHDGTSWVAIGGAGFTPERGAVHMYSATWDDVTEEFRYYVDGVLVQMTSAPGSSIATNANDLFLLAGGTTLAAEAWLFEARLWDRALSSGEIAARWNKQLAPALETGLVAYWKAEDGSGTNLADETTAGNDGTLNGGVAWSHSKATLQGSTAWVGSGEGGAELAGKSVPTGTGRLRHVPLYNVDPLADVFLGVEGPMEGYEEVMEGAKVLTGGGDVADVWAHSFTTEDYVTSKAHGFVRLASAPTLPLTANLKGDSSSGLGYVADSAEVVRRLTTRRGGILDPSEVEALSFQEVTLEAPQEVGVYTGLEPVNLTEVLGRVMRGVHGGFTFDRSAKLSVFQLKDPATRTPIVELTEDDVRVSGLTRRPTEDPSWRQTVGGCRHHFVFSVDQIHLDVTDEAVRARLQQEYCYQSHSNNFTKSVYLGSEDLTLTTAVYDEAEVKAEAVARMELFGKRRHFYEAPLLVGLFQYELGDVVELRVPRFGLDDGRNLVVVGWVEDVKSSNIVLTLWG